MGRAYLAVQPPDVRADWLATLQRAAGPGGAALVADARKAIDAFAHDGCCYSFRAWHDDVNAAAVPFRDPRQDRWLVLSCSGPASSMAEVVFRKDVAPRLCALAARLGAPAPG
jgi:DNA-binding IclR family transcriptional regulator